MLIMACICALGLVLFALGLVGGLTGPNGQSWGEPVMWLGVVLFVVGLVMLVGLALYHLCH